MVKPESRPVLSHVARRLPRIPVELSALLQGIEKDFPTILKNNLVGIYVWGSPTYNTFDKRCSDVDSIVVTRSDVSDAEFATLTRWFRKSARRNPWTRRLDMRFVIDREFLDKTSRCCGLCSGKLTRHGSDANPIIWMNIGKCGVTLWGKEARKIAPAVSTRRMDAALRLELDYLSEDLKKNAGSHSDRAFRHNAYAVLTACRILYTACFRTITSEERAYRWASVSLPRECRPVLAAAWSNRVKKRGVTTRRLESDAADLVCFAHERIGAGTQ